MKKNTEREKKVARKDFKLRNKSRLKKKEKYFWKEMQFLSTKKIKIPTVKLWNNKKTIINNVNKTDSEE